MKKLLLILLFAGTTVLADKYPRNWDIDVQHYQFQLVLQDNSDEISGTATIIVYFSDDEESLILDLISSAGNSGMSVRDVAVKSHKANHVHKDNRLSITIPGAFRKGNTYEVVITYSGIPRDGLIIAENKFGDRTFFGDNYPDRARHWLPTVDHPSDKATVEWVITAPEQYMVVGSGLKLEESQLGTGRKLTRWRQGVPISTKIMVIGVSRFAVSESGRMRDVSIQSWVYPQNREAGFFDYYPAADILRFYDAFIGEYPYEKLANVQSKTRYGGMENASNIFYFENSVTGEQSMNGLLAHEIAHQWFGNSVTEKSWHHAWLSEGLTSYFTHVYKEFAEGVDVKRQGLARDRENIIKYHAKSPHPIVYTSVTDYNKMLNTNTYQKGSWVMNMLRRKVGDDVFFEGMRTYYKRFRDGNALTDDLKSVMEEVSDQELDLFFDQWVYGQGHLVLSISYQYKAARSELEIEIVQQQDDPFAFDIEFLVDDELEVISITETKTTITVSVESEPEVQVDPYVWLLYEDQS